jgi:WD40 repeat protein
MVAMFLLCCSVPQDLPAGKSSQWKAHDKPISVIAAFTDGSRILSGSLDGNAHMWKVTPSTGRAELIKSFSVNSGVGVQRKIYCAAISSDDKSVALGCDDGTVWLFALQQDEPRILKGHREAIGFLSFSRDGKELISTDIGGTNNSSGEFRQWKLPVGTGQLVLGPSSVSGFYARRAAISWDHRTVFLGKVVVDLTTKRKIGEFSGDTSGEFCISPGGSFIAFAGENSEKARILNIKTGQVAFETPSHNGAVNRIRFSPDGKRLMTHGNGVLRLWNISQREELLRTEPLRLPD